MRTPSFPAAASSWLYSLPSREKIVVDLLRAKGLQDAPSLGVPALVQSAFAEADHKLNTTSFIGHSGCTACVVAIRGDDVICANLGDSRAVFSRCGLTLPLSHDHKPDSVSSAFRAREALHISLSL